jgi:hypothetical protein
MDSLKPWEKQGVSRATYFRQKSHEESQKEVSNETKPVSSETVVSRVVFNGSNGNICEDITREDIERCLENGSLTSRPNWYNEGFSSRNKVLEVFQ